jgi:hypothetical protein
MVGMPIKVSITDQPHAQKGQALLGGASILMARPNGFKCQLGGQIYTQSPIQIGSSVIWKWETLVSCPKGFKCDKQMQGSKGTNFWIDCNPKPN